MTCGLDQAFDSSVWDTTASQIANSYGKHEFIDILPAGS